MPANTDLETAVSPPYFADPATPHLSIDSVMHTTTMAPAPKKMHAPTLTIVKSVQANTVENSTQSSNRISHFNSPEIPAQALLSPSPLQSKIKITTPPPPPPKEKRKKKKSV